MPRVRNEVNFQQKREQILAIATQCFIESGFHGTGMAKICKAADMSAGALYRYFPSKESMIEAIVEQEKADYVFFLERLKASENKAASLAEMMVEAVHSFAEDRSYCQISVEILAEASRNPVVAALINNAYVELLSSLSDIVQEGQAAGHIDTTLLPNSTARLLVAITDGLIGQFAVQTDLNTEAIAQNAKRAVLNLLSP
jgi:TetR/AcrR family transcriptional regulator, repressor for uid operon